MKLFILKAFIALVILILAFEHMPQANAQGTEDEGIIEQQELQQGELQVEGQPKAEKDNAITDSLKEDEELPPPAEAPYPGAHEEGFTQEAQTPSAHAAPQSQTMRLEQPIKKSDGIYTYGVKESDKSGAMTLKGGVFGPPAIQNHKNGLFFKDIYEAKTFPTLFLDYEWQLKTALGEISAKIGSGIFYASGYGHFTDSTRRTEKPPESFTFLMFPNTVSANYRLNVIRNQWVVPYVEGGAGYFTFVEFADDNRAPKYAGAPVTFFAGGAAFLLDWFDKSAIAELDREYGVNHVYLTAEFKEFVGLDKRYDFSSRVIGGGIMMDF